MEYDDFLEHYKRQSFNKTIEFLILKNNNYGVIVSIYKMKTLYDLYKDIEILFESKSFMLKSEDDQIVPKSNMQIMQFFTRDVFKPVFKFPQEIVYKLYYVQSLTGPILVNSHESHY